MHLVRRGPWATLDLDVTNGHVFVRQDWYYEWSAPKGLPPWTDAEKHAYHHAVDHLIWGHWSMRATILVSPREIRDGRVQRTAVLALRFWIASSGFADAAFSASGSERRSAAPPYPFNHCKEEADCQPCQGPLPPPEDRLDTTHSHWPYEGAHIHQHSWEWQQNPKDCRCFAKKIDLGVTCL